MLKTRQTIRRPGAGTGVPARRAAAIAAIAVLALAASACTADASALGQKALTATSGQEETLTGAELQAFYADAEKDDDGSDDPLIVPKDADAAPADTDAAQADTDTAQAEAGEGGEGDSETDSESTDPAPEVTLQGIDPDYKKRDPKNDPVKINMEIATPVALQRDYYTVSKGSVGCEDLPDRPAYTIEANGLSHFCLDGSKAVDAKLEAWYKIPGGKDVLWIRVSVPYWGYNELDCEVRKAGTTQRSVDSKYTCEKAWLTDGGQGNNPHPKIKLVPKKVVEVTNVAQARTLLKENCGANQPRCTYENATSWVALDDWSEREILSGPAFNCNNPHEPDHHEWSKGQTYEWKNKIGVEAGIKWQVVPEVVKLEASAHYEHEWTEAYDFKQKLEAPVAYETAHYFFTQQGKIHIKGDFYISLKDYVYLIKDTEFELPLAKQYVLDRGLGRVIEPVAWASSAYPIKCKNGRPVALPNPFKDEPLEVEGGVQ